VAAELVTAAMASVAGQLAGPQPRLTCGWSASAVPAELADPAAVKVLAVPEKRSQEAAMLNDLYALTPPFLMCAAFLIGVGAFLRHEMRRAKNSGEDDDPEVSGPGSECDDSGNPASASAKARADRARSDDSTGPAV
jgi:hypothetical protein